MFLLLQSPEVLLFINHVRMCHPKGVYFFLRRFDVESGMGTTEVHERINLSFGFQMNKKQRVSRKFEMDFKKSVGFPI